MSERDFVIFEYVPSRKGASLVKIAMKQCGLKKCKFTKDSMMAGFYHVEGSGSEVAARAYLTMRWDVSDWSKSK